ncbi:MAG: methyltransferase domain-containing protein [Candidatus Theseobacter exili]|nr:methyltransferase domain-containing protein [Candidatus Theseobacter exili]
MNHNYVHGYSLRETQRLREQSVILEELLHSDINYSQGNKILEAGCGVGAQTVILAKNNPDSYFTSIDISQDSINQARRRIDDEGISNVLFKKADINNLPFAENSFDHIFICFVLEHLGKPQAVLSKLMNYLKPGGSVTVIEGDHGSCFWSPRTKASEAVWISFIKTQSGLNHNGLIGREIYPLLKYSGFERIDVSPKFAYADGSNVKLLDSVLNQIIIPMVQTAKDRAISENLIDITTWQTGINDLKKAGQPPDGTFFYTWFKGIGIKP